ncbi:hypothetical protein [Shewanella waksmanii]|uniref:hypothetical protein n=1 Tax=Shewanella waksmanii TaxID=213783 RepID=UPI00048DF5FB|nr:hypothetical protein [Shewanella waksmanii]
MLGEIILVDDLKPAELLAEVAPYESRASQTWKQLNEFHFESLFQIVSGSPEESFKDDIKVHTADDGEVWLVVISNDFRDLLASQSPENYQETANKWAVTDEFKWGWDKADILSLYGDLCAMAQKAKLKKQALVYWGRL